MSVGHTSWELELLVDRVVLILLHADGIVLGLWVLLGIGLIHGDLTDDLVTQLLQDLVKEKLDVLARVLRLLLNLLGD